VNQYLDYLSIGPLFFNIIQKVLTHYKILLTDCAAPRSKSLFMNIFQHEKKIRSFNRFEDEHILSIIL